MSDETQTQEPAATGGDNNEMLQRSIEALERKNKELIAELRAADVKQYIRYICDRRLISLGMKGVFKVKKNPLPWVEEMINAPTHTNFFENRATDYAKGALSGNWEDVWGAAA